METSTLLNGSRQSIVYPFPETNVATSKPRRVMAKADRHELFSIVILGIGTLFLMTGYDTQSFVVESVLHSVSAREPGKIDPHAGYYGQAALYASYTLSTLLSPWLCYRLGSRWTLLGGSLLFTLYLCGFFFLNSAFYYISQVLMGIGFALYYSGQGLYMAEHSRRDTISRNSALISVIGNAGMCVGGAVLYVITTYSPKTADSLETALNTTAGHNDVAYRHFSQTDIYILFGAFAAATALANVIFALLPNKQYESIAQTEKVDIPTMKTQMSLIGGAMSEPRILLLTPFFVCYGLQVSFMLSALPTTFSFTKTLSAHPHLPAIYSVCIGGGNIIMGLYINYFSRRWPSFGLSPTMATQLVLAAAAYSCILLGTPNTASIQPSSDETLLFHPTATLALLMGILLGMADGCLCPMRVIVCTLVAPQKKLQTYSVAKLYQSLASCIAFLASPYLTIQHWIALLTVSQIISGIAFFIVARKINKDSSAVVVDSTPSDMKTLTTA